MMDFTKLGGKLEEMKDSMQKVHERIKAIRVSKEAGAGLVKVTMTGEKKLVALVIDGKILSSGEQEMVQDLVMAAVNLAVVEVEEETKRQHREASLEVLGPLMMGM